MRRMLAAVFLALLSACAATVAARPPEASVSTELSSEGPGFWSDLGRVAGYAVVGAGAGAAIGLAALECQNEDCLTGLVFASALIPIGAVIGAGYGVVESIREHKKHAAAVV